eukprot:COSAG01_NODE_3587_length_5905_cov_36.428522_3_plen_85_part_00
MRTGSTTARVMPCVRYTEGHTASTATMGTGTGRLLRTAGAGAVAWLAGPAMHGHAVIICMYIGGVCTARPLGNAGQGALGRGAG